MSMINAESSIIIIDCGSTSRVLKEWLRGMQKSHIQPNMTAERKKNETMSLK